MREELPRTLQKALEEQRLGGAGLGALQPHEMFEAAIRDDLIKAWPPARIARLPPEKA